MSDLIEREKACEILLRRTGQCYGDCTSLCLSCAAEKDVAALRALPPAEAIEEMARRLGDIEAGCDIRKPHGLYRQVPVVIGPGPTTDQVRAQKLEAEVETLRTVLAEVLTTTFGHGPSPGWLDARQRAVCALQGVPLPERTQWLKQSIAAISSDQVSVCTSAAILRPDLVGKPAPLQGGPHPGCTTVVFGPCGCENKPAAPVAGGAA